MTRKLNWQEVEQETGENAKELLKQRGCESEAEFSFCMTIGNYSYFENLRREISNTERDIESKKRTLIYLQDRLEESIKAANAIYTA